MTATTQRLGLLGERIAERWLRARGWAVVERRWRSGRRDVDLIAVQAGTVAFVEVKARRRNSFGGPVEAVGWRKRRELERSALCWMDRCGPPGHAYRFDVIGVWVDADRVRIRHVADAFGVAPSA